MLVIGAFESPDGRAPEGRALGVTLVPTVAEVAADFFKAIAPAKTSKKLRLTNAPDLTNLPTHTALTPGALSILRLEGMSREQSRSSASTRLSLGTPNRQNRAADAA
jgi:hypothetical protein